MRDRNLDVEREHALLKIEFEQMEIKLRESKDIIDKLDDKNEELVQENSKLDKCNISITMDLEKEKDRSKVKLDSYKSEESKRSKEKMILLTYWR